MINILEEFIIYKVELWEINVALLFSEKVI